MNTSYRIKSDLKKKLDIFDHNKSRCDPLDYLYLGSSSISSK